MFGKSLMVAPIVNAHYTPEKTVAVDLMSGWDHNGNGEEGEIHIEPFTDVKPHEVYLPAGVDWYDYFTGEKYSGGQSITMQTTLQTIPLFAKAG